LVFSFYCGLRLDALSQRTKAQQTPSPVTPVNEKAARSQAEKIASTDNFHFTAAAGSISIARAEVMPFQNAVQYLQDQKYGCGYDATRDTNSLVWLVILNGSWPQNFPPAATPAPTYLPWHSLAVVLDAASGEMVCMGARK